MAFSVACAGCGVVLQGDEARIRGISVEYCGDEYIHTWAWCDVCRAWTEERYHDRFLGDSEISVSGPIADERLAPFFELLASCPHPHDKNCDCPAHKEQRGY